MLPDGYTTPVRLPWSSANPTTHRLPLSRYGAIHRLFCRVSDTPEALVECVLTQRTDGRFVIALYAGAFGEVSWRHWPVYDSPLRAESAILRALHRLYGVTAPEWVGAPGAPRVPRVQELVAEVVR